MSEAKHTRGPWVLSALVDDGYRYISSPGEWNNLARVVVRNPDVEPAEAEANAHLMVQAPAMFDMLADIAGGLENRGVLTPEQEKEVLDDYVIQIRALIAAIKRGGLMDDGEKLRAIEETIRDYHAALSRREHGGIAGTRAFSAIQEIVGIRSL